MQSDPTPTTDGIVLIMARASYESRCKSLGLPFGNHPLEANWSGLDRPYQLGATIQRELAAARAAIDALHGAGYQILPCEVIKDAS